MKMGYLLFGLCLLLISEETLGESTNIPVPDYQWPLGSKSLFFETIDKNDFLTPSNEQCYPFSSTDDIFPYEAMTFGSSSNDLRNLQTDLHDDSEFKNLSMSMYVKPKGTPTGTLLHYVLGSEEKIRINFVMSHTVVSFRDEYANPTGLVAAEDLLKPDEWNHLYIERQYETGTIKIYVNGEQKVNANDDFQKNIPMPTGGRLVLGNAVTKDANAGDQQFHGHITCLQIYTKLIPENDITQIWQNCLPENWTYRPPKFYLIPKGPLKCVSDTPPPTPKPPPVENLVTRTILTNEKSWNEFKEKFNWQTGLRTTAYFKMRVQNKRPSVVPISIVNATDLSVCTRLCMRIKDCQSFAIDEPTHFSLTCRVYNSVYGDLVADEGFRYFGLV